MAHSSLRQKSGVKFVLDIVDVYFSKHVSRSAAELAYFLILTLFPILLCVNAFLGMLDVDLTAMLAEADFLPPGSDEVIADYLSYVSVNNSPALLAAGVVTTLLCASAGVRSLLNIMEEIYGNATFRGFKRLVASFAISILLIIAIYFSLAVVLTGNWFFHLIGENFNIPDILETVGLWQSLKYLIQWAVVFLLILFLYRVSAPLGKPRPPVMTGALLSSAVLAVATRIFANVMAASTRYSLVYGSLAALMILLVWLYFCGNIVILGNVFNYVWYTRKKVKYAKQKIEETGKLRLKEHREELEGRG